MTSKTRAGSTQKIKPAESILSNRFTAKLLSHMKVIDPNVTKVQKKPSTKVNPSTHRAALHPPVPEKQHKSKPSATKKRIKRDEDDIPKKHKKLVEKYSSESFESGKNSRTKLEDDKQKSQQGQKKKHLKEIMRKIKIFDYKQGLFKDNFRKSPVFKWNNKNPYGKIDRIYRHLLYMEKEELVLLKKVDLFKLHYPLKVVRKELKQAKKLWDFVHIVKPQLIEFKKFKNNLKSREEVCLDFKEELKKIDNLKGCDAYDKLAENIDFVLGCIATVSEIKDPGLRENLWKEMIVKSMVTKSN